MDRGMLEAWLEGYIRAWGSNEPDEIGALFADDARYYTALIDLRKVPGLTEISVDGGAVTIGAMVTLAEVARSEAI